MSPRTLTVACFGQIAGTLHQGNPDMEFAYDDRWVGDGRPPLSQSLPLDGNFAPGAAEAFFGGLLPEGAIRETLARKLGVSVQNSFSLLAELGGDTAGAISVIAPGTPLPGDEDVEVEWLNDRQLAEQIDELPIRPMHADADGEWRLSLAGAQDKLPVVVDDSGRVGLTKGRTPSTHILKTAIERLTGTVANEAFSLALAGRLGLPAATAQPRRVEGREFLLVKRYDRVEVDGRTRRLHQEDFCQALGIRSENKYESEGGPGTEHCFALLRAAVSTPALEAPKLLDSIGMSFLLGNHDAHGKNFSLLYSAGSARATLAPAYDLLSTFAYSAKYDLSRKMAMRIGGENRPDYVRDRHLDRMLDTAGLANAPAKRRLRALADAAPKEAANLRREFDRQGWGDPILEQVVGVIETRSAMLLEIAAPRRSSK